MLLLPADDLRQNGKTMKIKASGKILVTGATGFIGRRLVKKLIEKGYSVRCLVRKFTDLPKEAEQVHGDLLQPDALNAAFAGISVAYYLVHSMGAGKGDFAEKDRQAAKKLCSSGKCRRSRADNISGRTWRDGRQSFSSPCQSA
jgi:NAD(P)-dependent dehydrogenase (short-subunit alcohol dehydrogenase family)